MAKQDFSQDFFEFLKKTWNPLSFPLTGMVMPTTSIEELDKKISELKTVETWLTANIGFVQMAMKTFEMQKAALENLQRSSAGSPPTDNSTPKA